MVLATDPLCYLCKTTKKFLQRCLQVAESVRESVLILKLRLWIKVQNLLDIPFLNLSLMFFLFSLFEFNVSLINLRVLRKHLVCRLQHFLHFPHLSSNKIISFLDLFKSLVLFLGKLVFLLFDCISFDLVGFNFYLFVWIYILYSYLEIYQTLWESLDIDLDLLRDLELV